MVSVLLLDAVGLTPRQIGPDTPHLAALAARGGQFALQTVLPAVTCTAQATLLTGLAPTDHGAVGNGWFYRDRGEVALWKQSNALVQGEKLYEWGRREVPGFTSAKLFWWWNQGAAVDWAVTPKPHYGADGSKAFDIDSWPRELGPELTAELGPFPFFEFWGPKSGLGSTRWIADATRLVLRARTPTLTLAYLPHLDYDHQRCGPTGTRAVQALRELDGVVGELVAAADALEIATVVVSEYGIEAADTPIGINRELRRAGLLEVRDGPFGETLDTFNSRAFAVADHQLAHVYLSRTASPRGATDPNAVRPLLEDLEGVDLVLDDEGKRAAGIAHPNAGELVCVARKGAWFTYPYWLDDGRAPDFARTVDIHRKPGYDPCELFLDPALRLPVLRVANRLARKKLGLRYLMDVIPLDASLVRGTHGRLPDDPADGPLWIGSVEPREAVTSLAGANVALRELLARPADRA